MKLKFKLPDNYKNSFFWIMIYFAVLAIVFFAIGDIMLGVINLSYAFFEFILWRQNLMVKRLIKLNDELTDILKQYHECFVSLAFRTTSPAQGKTDSNESDNQN